MSVPSLALLWMLRCESVLIEGMRGCVGRTSHCLLSLALCILCVCVCVCVFGLSGGACRLERVCPLPPTAFHRSLNKKQPCWPSHHWPPLQCKGERSVTCLE